MPTIAFDVLGTMFPLTKVGEKLSEVVHQRINKLGFEMSGNYRLDPKHCTQLLSAETLRDFLALSHSGTYSPLQAVLKGAVKRLISVLIHDAIPEQQQQQQADYEPTNEEVQSVMQQLELLEPRQGTVEAIKKLCSLSPQFSELQGVSPATVLKERRRWTILALTNGSVEFTEKMLEKLGLRDYFLAVLSCDSIRISKPHPRTYELVREVLTDYDDDELWMVSVHSWDVNGAARAGLKTVFVAEQEREYLQVEGYQKPDITAQTILEAAEKIINYEAQTKSETMY